MDKAVDILNNTFGYENWRPYQEHIINSLLENKDVLAILPTSAGKSICYQIPGIVREGLTIVISPLISLMVDQVTRLKSMNIRAEFLNSNLDMRGIQYIESLALDGELDLLYVSPEKIMSNDFIAFMHSLKINAFAIDEAHCISSWGPDFRVEYTKLVMLKTKFPDTPIIALTATADTKTRKDIVTQLKMVNPVLVVASFDRPNLSLHIAEGKDRLEQIVRFIKSRPDDVGIIYCLSRKDTEGMTASLKKCGIDSAYYHAGMDSRSRSKVQQDFLESTTKIIVATVAFGMGIDKSDIRWVIHYSMPKNMEGYYQEIGRAGRDGKPSDSIMFYTYSDVKKNEFLLKDLTGNQKTIQIQKLAKMKIYAEEQSKCRRKLLLAYFDEVSNKDCMNCDICLKTNIIPAKVLAPGARIVTITPKTITIPKPTTIQIEKKLSTYDKTYELYKANKTPEEMAKERDIGLMSIYTHLAMLYTLGRDIDMKKYVTQQEIDEVTKVIEELNNPKELAPIRKKTPNVSYDKIRLIKAIYEKENTV